MDANAMMYQEIVKETVFKHSQSGGITIEALKAELNDVPEDVIDSVIENYMFGGQIEETDDGKLLMTSYF